MKLTNKYFCSTVPVKVNISMSSATHTVDSDWYMTCLADGHPIPTVVWYKDGQQINNNERIEQIGWYTNK